MVNMEREISKILDLIITYSRLDIWGDHFTADNWQDIFDAYSMQEQRHTLSFHNGASKLVMVFDELPFVIKIPFTGFYDSEVDEIVEELYYGFECANDEGWDYCLTEEMLYEQMGSNDAKRYFAKTKKIGEVRGYPIYIQEKAIPWANSVNYKKSQKLSKEQKEKVSSLRDEIGYCSGFVSNWILFFLETEKKEDFLKLIDLIQKFEIGDLWMANYGISAITHKPIIFDYSGFYD